MPDRTPAWLRKKRAAILKEIDKAKKTRAIHRRKGRGKRFGPHWAAATPRVLTLKKYVGDVVYHAARNRYSGDVLDAAAQSMERFRDRANERRLRREQRLIRRAERKGWTLERIEAEKARYIARDKQIYRQRTKQFEPLRDAKGRKAGGGIYIVDGREYGRARTRRGLAGLRRRFEKDNHIRKVAKAFGLNKKEARSLIEHAVNLSHRRLRDFKKTREFKRKKARDKARYTRKRWEGLSVAVLFRLAEVEEYE